MSELKETLIGFLKDNLDVFTWSRKDIPGIDPEMIVHKLNVDPNFKPVKHKRRSFNPKRYDAIKKEVDKLLKARPIREVLYPTWLENVVLVKKSNGEW